ncbi:hypothetical protein N9J90_01375 [Candidatus Pelagibacter sp.]|jgi:hypothetical protein|nr:hypothetical protein [Candidatus Pelagibacter sp.]MDA9083814.1 hypothetical protein [Candidatus Pelagibacter sp.]
MILKKMIISVFAMCFLTGCLQNTAFLGPAVTVASTGNVYQAGLSYGSSHAIKKMTGKTPTENVKSFLDSNNTTVKEEVHNEFFLLVKDKIEKKSNISNLANQ